MAASTALAIGGLALAAVGTGIQFVAGRRQAKAQEDAIETQKAQQKVQERRQRRRVLRQRRIARAQTLNVASQTGAGRSSGVSGGLSGLESQAGAELGFINTTAGLSDKLFGANRRAASAASLGSLGGGISNLGFGLFNARNVSFGRSPEPPPTRQSMGLAGGGFTGRGQGRVPIGF